MSALPINPLILSLTVMALSGCMSETQFHHLLDAPPSGRDAETFGAVAEQSLDAEPSATWARMYERDGQDDTTTDPGASESQVDSPNANTGPVCDAGPDIHAIVGEVVTLDASRSYDPDGDAIDYDWGVSNQPDHSGCCASPHPFDSYAEAPYFTPDVPGEYAFNLLVSDGTLRRTDSVIVYVRAADNPHDSDDPGDRYVSDLDDKSSVDVPGESHSPTGAVVPGADGKDGVDDGFGQLADTYVGTNEDIGPDSCAVDDEIQFFARCQQGVAERVRAESLQAMEAAESALESTISLQARGDELLEGCAEATAVADQAFEDAFQRGENTAGFGLADHLRLQRAYGRATGLSILARNCLTP